MKLSDLETRYGSPGSLGYYGGYIDSRTPGTYAISLSTFSAFSVPYFSNISHTSAPITSVRVFGRFYTGGLTNAIAGGGFGKVYIRLGPAITLWSQLDTYDVTNEMTWNAAGYWYIDFIWYGLSQQTQYKFRYELLECGYQGRGNVISSSLTFITGGSGGSGGS